jgi:hypothetical protein
MSTLQDDAAMANDERDERPGDPGGGDSWLAEQIRLITLEDGAGS